MEVALRDVRWVRSGNLLLDVPQLVLSGPGLTLVTGASGSGKSSLLKALTGTLEEFQGGHVSGSMDATVNGSRAAKVGFVPQDARDTFLAHSPVTEFQLRLQALGWKHDRAKIESMRLLETYGLGNRASVPIHRLSAGERRRLAMFASRIHRPDVLLLDEPLNHLDAHWRATIVNEVSGFAQNALVVVATHEPDPWRPVAGRVLHVDQGNVADAPPVFTHAPPPPRPPTMAAHVSPRLVATAVTDRHGLFAPISVRFPAGLHAVAGPNGSGKSTLLRVLGGLEKPETGNVSFDGNDIHALTPSRQSMFRAHHIEEPRDTFFMERGRDEIRFQPMNARVPSDEIDSRINESARTFSMADLIDRHPLALSGGEQERLALACTAAAKAALLLFDEPTNGLDLQGRKALLRFLDAASRDSCVILATHDEELLAQCDTVHRFTEGRLVPVRTHVGTQLVEVRPRAP